MSAEKGVSRRKFLASAAGSAVVAAGAGFGAGVSFAPKEERQIIVPSLQMRPGPGVSPDERALFEAAKIARDSPVRKLSVLIPDGSVPQWEFAKEPWKNFVGVDIELIPTPYLEASVKAIAEAVSKSGAYDIILSSYPFTPDYSEAGLAADIGPLVTKYGAGLDEWPCAMFPPFLKMSKYKGSYRGLINDGDVWHLYLRKDLLEDPQYKQKFKDKYGYALDYPNTWKELNDQIEFFDNTGAGVRGGWFFRERYFFIFEWLMRFVSKGGVLFDDQMKAKINSREGVEALTEMNAVNQYMDASTVSGSYTELYTDAPAGKVYAGMAWGSLGRVLAGEGSQVRGKMTTAPIPGSIVDGKLIRAACFVDGFGVTVSNYSKNLDLAYLLVQYMQSPAVSGKSISIPGFLDAFRECHLTIPGLADTYPHNFIPASKANIDASIPDVMLKGITEYRDIANKNFQLSASGQLTVQDALNRTGEEWDKITERQGMQLQLQQWNYLKTAYPDDVRALHGW